MPPRNAFSHALRQRSKSLPSKSKKSILYGQKSNPSYKQQLRMVSINSKKDQEPKSQTDIPAVQRVLDEFEHVLKNLQMTNSDITDLNVLMKELRDCISHFPRFLSANPEQKDSFFKSWDNLKTQAIEKLNSGRPCSYETASKELQKSKESLEKIPTKSQFKQANSVIEELLNNIQNIQNKLNDLIQNKSNESYDQKELYKQVSIIKTDLNNLQFMAPTTDFNQSIARVLLEFNKVEKKEKSLQILNRNIQKTEKQLQALIQVKPRAEQNLNRKDEQALSTVSSKKKRPKSVGAFDNKSRISRTSRLSSMSLVSKQLNDYDKKIGVAKSQSLNLNHEINSLNIKINRIQKSIANYQAQLDEITEANSIERDSYKRKLADKIRKSGIPGCESYEQKEKYLAIERKNNLDFRQRLKEIEANEHERLQLNHKIHEIEDWQMQIDEELKRAQNLHACLVKLTAEDNLNTLNANSNGAMEIKVDNDSLQEETETIKTKIADTQKSINDWRDSWKKSVGEDLIDDLESAEQNNIKIMFKRSEFDQQYMSNWSKELDLQIEELEKEASLLKQNTQSLDDDSLNKLKEAVTKLSFYQSNTNSEIRSLPITQQIQINKIEIDRLSKSENETKSESQEIEDQRNQNRQMIDWVKEILDQIQSALTSQNGFKAQLNKSMKITNVDNNNDITKHNDSNNDKNEKLNQEIEELSDAIFSRDKIKSEYEDNNTNMQQLYENMFYVQTSNQSFMELCPQVKERIRKLIRYHQLKRQYDHLLNPDAQNDYSDPIYKVEYANADSQDDESQTDNGNIDYPPGGNNGYSDSESGYGADVF
ncbi:hypothetical protein M9Y10_043628 [Tritrichomonas musculus]|uniref:Uncharacterized protein n=1 Tax=Tritrichomonas musculus TaxID=1915356 RepID=A0ABR2K081_9EUKA